MNNKISYIIIYLHLYLYNLFALHIRHFYVRLLRIKLYTIYAVIWIVVNIAWGLYAPKFSRNPNNRVILYKYILYSNTNNNYKVLYYKHAYYLFYRKTGWLGLRSDLYLFVCDNIKYKNEKEVGFWYRIVYYYYYYDIKCSSRVIIFNII